MSTLRSAVKMALFTVVTLLATGLLAATIARLCEGQVLELQHTFDAEELAKKKGLLQRLDPRVKHDEPKNRSDLGMAWSEKVAGKTAAQGVKAWHGTSKRAWERLLANQGKAESIRDLCSMVERDLGPHFAFIFEVGLQRVEQFHGVA